MDINYNTFLSIINLKKLYLIFNFLIIFLFFNFIFTCSAYRDITYTFTFTKPAYSF
jgi:hypothetical protein